MKSSTRFSCLLPAVAVIYVGVLGTASADTFLWNTNGNGSWTNTANWNPSTGFPNANADVADLSQLNITAHPTITLDAAITVGQLLIGDTNQSNVYTINSGTGGSLTFNNTGGSGNAKLTVTAGSGSLSNNAAVLSTGITLQTNLDVANFNTVAGGRQFNLTGSTIALGGNTLDLSAGFGNLTHPGINLGAVTGSGTVSKSGAGYVRATGAIANTATVQVNQGQMSFASTSLTAGSIIIASGAEALYESSGTVTYSGAISGQGDFVMQTLSGNVRLSGNNTHTGDTVVNSGTLTLNSVGQLAFGIGASGVNNSILGSGTAELNGNFSFDLTGAATGVGSLWEIVSVDTLTESWGSTFNIVDFSRVGGGTGAGLWTRTFSGADFEFDTTSGVLQVVPEPSTMAMVAMAALGAMALRRRRI